MDRFMSESARKITAELDAAPVDGQLLELPQNSEDLVGDAWPEMDFEPLPSEIQQHLGAKNFCGAVEVSKALFQQPMNPSQVQRIANLFAGLGTMAYDPELGGGGFSPSRQEAPKLICEAVRLYKLAYGKAKERHKAEVAVEFLSFLLEPHRPKDAGECKLARRLFAVVDRHYRRIGRHGAALFMLGFLFWLEDKERKALNVFMQAAKLGKEACGGLEWIRLLRQGNVLAERISKPALKYFRRLAELHGVFSIDAAPRTKLLAGEMRYQAFKNNFEASFRKFPP